MKKLCFLALSFCLLSSTGWSQDIAKGAKVYASCIQCHGEKGEGNVSEEGPKIAGQFSWYIESSIQAFLKGERKNPKMVAKIQGISAQDIKDVAAYVSSL